MLRIRGYFLPGVKPTVHDPRLDLLPSKLAYQKVLRRHELRFASSESFTWVSWVSRFRLRIERVRVGEVRRVAHREDEAAAVGRGGIGEDGVIPGGDRLRAPLCASNRTRFEAAVLGRGDDHRIAVRRPDGGARAPAAARRLAWSPITSVPMSKS